MVKLKEKSIMYKDCGDSSVNFAYHVYYSEYVWPGTSRALAYVI
jgi:hypothetical protein